MDPEQSTLSDEDIETTPIGSMTSPETDTGDDAGADDTGDTADTGDDSGDVTDTSDTGDDSGDAAA
jgi:hypothetical protein